ncbi:GNAT family N-acetyltransferase [Flaviflexus massiliensis]|uniref:GNAT family N-acetyltransferase n=1 Tax=Flaviflexus massiliensis TaxID=1522309 RepID=UPI0006D58B12|nr:GNAT family N-acetyltransferase [Flaviflexus massiliensis]
MVITRIETSEDLEGAFAVRKAVFVDEQHVPVEEELDDLDHAATTVHVLAKDDEGPCATGRILLDGPGQVHLGRICILPRVRGTGLGRKLMAELESIAYAEYCSDGRLVIALSAQDQAQGFYSALGYDYVDDREYLDAEIWHRDMSKTVTGVSD